MSNRSQSSSNLIIVLLLIITFPIWIGIFSAIFGIGLGIMGAIGGIFAALFGIIVAVITLPFRFVFGWNWCSHDDFSFFHLDGIVIVMFILLIAFVIKKRK